MLKLPILRLSSHGASAKATPAAFGVGQEDGISPGDLAMAAGSLDLLVKRVLPSWSVTESSLRGQGPHPQRAEIRLPVALALYPADLATVQNLAGYSDPATTARYDRRVERAMREAASHLHVPHFGE